MKLRLLSYNIQRGIHLERLLPVFANAPAFGDADIIAIQESSHLPNGENILQVLAAVLSSDHVWTYHPVMTYPDKEYGNGFLFRRDLQVVESYDVMLPQVDRLRWYEKKKTEGGVPDTKSAFVQVFHGAGRLVRIANVHLDFAGGPAHRRHQMAHLLAEMVQRPIGSHTDRSPAPVDIICGDFNTVGHHRLGATRTATASALRDVLGEGYADLTRDVAFTSDLLGSIDSADPAAGMLRLARGLGLKFRQKTDHILARGQLGVADAGLAAGPVAELLRISDHLPLQVTLEL